MQNVVIMIQVLSGEQDKKLTCNHRCDHGTTSSTPPFAGSEMLTKNTGCLEHSTTGEIRHSLINKLSTFVQGRSTCHTVTSNTSCIEVKLSFEDLRVMTTLLLKFTHSRPFLIVRTVGHVDISCRNVDLDVVCNTS